MKSSAAEPGIAAALQGIPCSSRLLVAFSGGVDSHALLHSLAGRRQARGWTLAAVHVDHHLHPGSRDWVRHCAQVCSELAVSLRIVDVDARPRGGESPEAAARGARYRALGQLLGTGDLLLTAQHQDDQAETVLLQLMRGGGLAGLAGMPRMRTLGRGRLLRPLLQVSRQQILEYARDHNLEWLEDPSNRDTRIDRNFVRLQVLPGLRRRWPSASATLAGAASRSGEATDLLMALADIDSQHTLAAGAGLAGRHLAPLPVPRQRNLVRCWLRVEACQPPPGWAVGRIVDELLPATGSRAVVGWGEHEVRQYRGHLYVLGQTSPAAPGWRRRITVNDLAVLPDGSYARLVADGGTIDAGRLTGCRLEVGFRTGGEKLRVFEGGPRRTLKNLFQEAGIPPWRRVCWPLLFCAGRLVAVAGRWVEVEFTRPGADPAGLSFRWQTQSPSDSL